MKYTAQNLAEDIANDMELFSDGVEVQTSAHQHDDGVTSSMIISAEGTKFSITVRELP